MKITELLAEAMNDVDEHDPAQGLVKLVLDNGTWIYGHVSSPGPEFAAINQVIQVRPDRLVASDRVIHHPYLLHVDLDRIVTFRYADLQEVAR